MKHVGMFEAKTHLSSLVEEVEKGGEVAFEIIDTYRDFVDPVKGCSLN